MSLDGVEVNDGVWKKLLASAYDLDRAYVKVGVIASEAGTEDGGIGLAELAAVHEFGSPEVGIPERSFIRRTFANAPWLPSFTAKLAKAVITGGMPVARALAILGTKGAQEVKATIVDERVTPRLEDSDAGRRTIARKGSSVTLVDTARLVNGISYEVVLDDRGEEAPA